MGRKNYGRGFKIREADVRSYNRTRAPSGYRPNPMGVTSMMRVNGPRATSARAASAGRTTAQRLQHARNVMKGTGMKKNARAGKRAKFVKVKKNRTTGTKTRGRRLAAYNQARRRGLKPNSAARSAVRKVPFTSNERRQGSTFSGVKARMRQNPKWRPGGAKKGKRFKGGKSDEEQRRAEKKAKHAARLKKRGRLAAAGGVPALRKVKAPKKSKRRKAKKAKKSKAKKAARRPLASQYRTVTKTKKTKHKVRYRFGGYTRAKIKNYRTGRKQYSYLYRDQKTKRLRRIPISAILSGLNPEQAEKLKSEIIAGRRKAAEQIIQRGGVFVANKSKRRKSKGKSKRKSKAKRKGRATTPRKRAAMVGRLVRGGKSKKAARASALKRYPLLKREKAAKKGGKRRKGASKRKSRKSKGKRRAGAKRKSTKRKGKRRAGAKRLTRGKYYVANRRGKGRARAKARRRGRARRRRMTANQMGALFKKVMKTGLLITGGFLTHRLLTSLVCDHLLPAVMPAGNGGATEPPVEGFDFETFKRPLVGLAVLGVGVPLAGVAAKGVALELGAGMVASWAQSLVVSVLQAVDQPAVAGSLAGYGNSLAYQLRGRRSMRGVGQYRRGMRGRNLSSVMPRYAQVSGMRGMGQYRQAAAGLGTYRQAAAGAGGFGEYFVPNAVGEYFVPLNQLQGVGQYEPAGPLAMQASAGVGQTIDDGIRPDSNLDKLLDLAEAAAGAGGVRGVGEYYTAAPDNGGYRDQRIPTQDQWIPNGPLFAGAMSVNDTQQQADLPAGILAGSGGNGILSG